MSDLDNLLYLIDEDGRVFLCLGPVNIEVCDSADDFQDFIDSLLRKLNSMHDEMRELE